MTCSLVLRLGDFLVERQTVVNLQHKGRIYIAGSLGFYYNHNVHTIPPHTQVFENHCDKSSKPSLGEVHWDPI